LSFLFVIDDTNMTGRLRRALCSYKGEIMNFKELKSAIQKWVDDRQAILDHQFVLHVL